MWYHEYLGKPWQAYATGPDSFDCWGLVVHVLQKHYGIQSVPRCSHIQIGDYSRYTVTARLNLDSGPWQKVDKPIDGVVAFMGSRYLIRHIGICESGCILHCRDGAGVCIEQLSTLKNIGLRHIEFWKHNDL